MQNQIPKAILAGIIGTAIMTGVMIVAPMMGMPKMSPPTMLAGKMGMPLIGGWIAHFMIGIVFALIYSYLPGIHKIGNLWARGAVFGIIAFIMAQIGMRVMGAAPEGPMPMLAIASLIGHLVFGIAVAKTIGNTHSN